MKKLITAVLFFGVCISKALTVANAGNDMTACEGLLTYVSPNSFPTANETAYWIDLDGFIANPGDTLFSIGIEGSVLNGETKRLRYEITDGVTTSMDEMTVTGRGKPDISNVSIAIPQGCAGTLVNVVQAGGVGVDEWIFEEVSGAEVWQVSADRKSAQYKLLEDGSSTATISMYAVNTCGASGKITATNIINLKPTQVPVIDGDVVVCGSKSYTYSQLTSTTDATTWAWKWKGTAKGTASTLNLTSADFTSSGTLELVPSNTCGDGPAGTKAITVQAPFPAQVAIRFKDDKLKACEDEDALEIEVNTALSNGGIGATYEFFKGTTSLGLQSSVTIKSIVQGSWVNGDQFTVKMTPDAATGCFTGGAVTSSPILVDGYKTASVTLAANKTEICEIEEAITLTVGGLKKGDIVTNWWKDGTEVLDGGSSYSINKATQRGGYSASVSNSVCRDVVSNEVAVIIHEQPEINTTSFLTANQLGLQFDENETPISENYPVSISGLDLDLFDASYKWYSNELTVKQNTSDFEFTAQKGVLDTVSFVVTNGLCKDSTSFVVKDLDAVGLSDKVVLEANMVYPNPARSTAFVQINNPLKGGALEVYNLDGSLVYENQNANIIPTSGFATGVYMVRVVKDGVVFTSKLIVE